MMSGMMDEERTPNENREVSSEVVEKESGVYDSM